MSLASGFRLALGTLTIIPVGNIHPIPAGAARVAMLLAPLVVVPLAAVAGVLVWLGSWVGMPGVVVGALAVASVALGTRAMHLDGLADTVDGLGGGWSQERALEIMRRGDVGPMGVTALVLTLIIQVSCIAALSTLPWGGLLVAVAICASRFAVTALCSRPLPPARGSGMGAVVASSVPVPAVAVAGVASAAALTAATWVSGLAWPWGLVAMGVVAVVLLVFAHTARRKFGGITGDVLGAGVELALTGLLVVLVIPA